MTTFVLVPGAWHGAWCWCHLVSALEARGHAAVPLTLTGLGDRSHLIGPDISMTTHVQDVVNAVGWRDLTDYFLYGHSYGGIVISAAAEELERDLRGIFYIDALYPKNGETCSEVVNNSPPRDSEIAPPNVEMFAIEDEHWRAKVARLMTPHPSNSLLEPVSLTGARDRIARRAFIVGSNLQRPLFTATRDALSKAGRWRLHDLPTGHRPMIDAPDSLADILCDVAA